MFDIILKSIELLISSLKSFKKNRQAANKERFGKKLIACYVRLTETIKAGEVILDQLELFERKYAEKKKTGDYWVYSPFYLEKVVGRQAVNLEKLADDLDDMSPELSILNPDLAVNIYLYITWKRSALSWLTHFLRENKLPLNVKLEYYTLGDDGNISPTIQFDDDIENTAREYFEGYQRRLQYGSRYYHEPETDVEAEIEGRFEKAFYKYEMKVDADVISIADKGEWNDYAYKKVKEFLDQGIQRKILQKLFTVSKDLRVLIIDNYSLEEILWDVKDFEKNLHF